MIARLSAYFMLLFYAAGTLLLPGGNFGVLHDLPAMYAHCKATEDKDLTPIDFITDHLTCFDAITDTHPPSDQQRPHTPPPNVRTSIPVQVQPRTLAAHLSAPEEMKAIAFGEKPDHYRHHHSALVFRPPIG